MTVLSRNVNHDPKWFARLPNEAYIRESQFLSVPNNPQPIIPIPSSTWWRWVRIGHAPKPIKLGPGVTAWKVGDLRKWITERSESQSQTEAT